jgi:PAS domain S-box-containing protein
MLMNASHELQKLVDAGVRFSLALEHNGWFSIRIGNYLSRPFASNYSPTFELAVAALTRLASVAPLAAVTSALRRERANSEQILLRLDLDGRITRINDHACALLEWPERELLGCDWIERCLPPSTQPALRRTFADLLSGDLSIVQNPVLTRPGDERMIEWVNILVRDEAGSVVGTLSSGADITELTKH